MTAVAIKSAPRGLQAYGSNKSTLRLTFTLLLILDPWLWTLTADYGLWFGFGVLVSALHLQDF